METKNEEMRRVMDRLDRVERQNRWLVRGGLVFTVLCGGALLMAQKPLARNVEAQGFVLKDAAGNIRAELHTSKLGPELAIWGDSPSVPDIMLRAGPHGPILSLLGGPGKGYALLEASEDGPHLSLTTGEAHVYLDVDKDGPSLRLRGAGQGNAQALLNAEENGPNLQLSHAGAGAHLSVTNNGSGLVLAGGGEGHEGALLIVQKGQPQLAFLGAGSNRNGEADFSVNLIAGANGSSLSLKDLEGFEATIGNQALVTPTTGEKRQSSAASIHLFDPKGKNLWSAP